MSRPFELWRTDRATRARVFRALADGAELTGEDDRRLAIGEATRIVRASPLLAGIAVFLVLIEGWAAATGHGWVHLLGVLLFTALGVQQVVQHRRAAAYLARFTPR